MRPTAVLLLTLLSTAACAGPVSLSDPKRAKLVSLITEDAEAKSRFTSLKKIADAALSADPNPIKFIRSEGKLKNDPERIATTKCLADVPEVAALGWAYAVTNEKQYADKARQFLLAWAKINESRGDPIDDTNLEDFIVAYDLVRATCSDADRKTIDSWFRQVANAEVASAQNKKVTSTINNWHSHRLKIVGLIALLLDDRKLLDYVKSAFHDQIERNLNPDGSSYDFHERDALHYHCYDLEPLITLCIAAKQANLGDWYSHTSSRGASIAKSVAFLVPYCDGTKTHAEWIHSKVDFDRKRAESGDPHYKPGTPFDPKAGRKTLELAAFFDPSLNPLVNKLAGDKAQRYSTWQQVVNAATR